jgi:hypothetical protein
MLAELPIYRMPSGFAGAEKGLMLIFANGGGILIPEAVVASLSVLRKATMSSISRSVKAGPALAARLNGARSLIILGK